MKRIFFAILAAAIISAEADAKYSGGSGSSSDPYLIATAEDMNQIGHNSGDWNKNFKMISDVNLSALGGMQFSRIGTDTAHQFNGVFNGDGRTIWRFTYTTGSFDYVGVFGNVGATGKIENLCLADVNVRGGNFAGGLAGENKGDVNNCSACGIVVGSNAMQGAGVLIGDNNGIIENCHSAGTVAGPNNTQNIGGLSGTNSGDINNCYSTADVNGGDWAGYIGGLIGDNFGNISNCFATGSVRGGDFSGNIGGLIGGSDSGNIDNCYAAGSVSGGNYSDNVGGLAGYNEDGSINNCYFLDGSGPDNGLGTALTDANMKKQASFAGWDFVWETANGTDDIWAICETGSYPIFARQFLAGDLDGDKDVDFTDFAAMGRKWRQNDSTFYCGGADLNGDGIVDLKDTAILCGHWLEGK